MSKRIKRYRYFWYQSVVDMIQSYETLDQYDTPLVQDYKRAIDKAFEYCDTLDYGESVKKAIYMIYIKKTHTITGAAEQLFVNEKTIKNWKSKFVYKVAEEVGLLPTKSNDKI